MFRFLTALLKKELKNSATSWSSDTITLFSTNVILSVDIVFSENNGFTVFQNFLLSHMFDGCKFSKYEAEQPSDLVVLGQNLKPKAIVVLEL